MHLIPTLFPNGWGHYLAGGVFIGVGVALLFLVTGLVGGMSSVYSTTWSYLSQRPFFQQPRFVGSRRWRLVYAAGLVVGAGLWWWLFGGERVAVAVPWWQLLLGGLLVGYGTRLSKGCTSGHGICGLGSLQWPSLVAVGVFMAAAMVTAWAVRAVVGVGVAA